MDLSLDSILLLGDPRLYQSCEEVTKNEIPNLIADIEKMAKLVILFRKKYGKGRAIAAPQIGLMKRIIVMNVTKPIAIINPVFIYKSESLFELWDDCMSFPNLLVRVKRHKHCTMQFRDTKWKLQTWDLKEHVSELMQHEHDHLDGILATQRAIDDQSFKWKNN